MAPHHGRGGPWYRGGSGAFPNLARVGDLEPVNELTRAEDGRSYMMKDS